KDGLKKFSATGERAPTPPERGLLHIWRSGGLGEQLSPERVLLSRPVLQAALGEHHGLLLTQGGLVYSFGELLWRDLSVPVSAPVLEVALQGKTVVRVAAGGFHCGALSEQGSVYMWGENTAGQCGQTEKVSEPCPVSVVDSEVVPPVTVRIIDLVCGREHSLALSAQNELWAWGSGCQLGLVTNTFPVWKPQKVEHLAGRHVIQVACGAYHSLALVRSLPPQNFNTQNPPEKKERGQSPHSSVTDRAEPSVVDDAHYCPLGVELSEVITGERYFIMRPCVFVPGSPRRRRPCACRRSSAGRTQAAAPEEAGDGLPSLDTEVWSWGRGSEGQLGHGDQLARLQPLCIKSLTGEEVIKVAAGSHHSLAVTAQCQVYSWGSNMCGQLGHVNSPVTVPKQAKVKKKKKTHKKNPKQAMGYISSVYSGGQSCAVLADQNIMGFISAIHELASRERQFYCWLSSVKKLLLTPIRNRGNRTSLKTLREICARFDRRVNKYVHTVAEKIIRPPLFSSISFSSFCLSCLIVCPSSECLGSQQAWPSQLCPSDQSTSGDLDLVSLLYWPLQQLHQYSRVLLKLASCYDVLTVEYQSLHQGCSQYEALSLSLLRKKKDAETTFIFWKTHSGKTTEFLRLPQRRVMCESSNRSLTVQNAGRFSNHWFILFNDALVHTQFSTHHVYPLTCLWVKPVTENTTGKTSHLLFLSPQNKWLRSLNQAVDQILGGGGQGSSPGVTAMTRTASYKFTGEGRFKDAQYTGSWLAGRINGRGTMKWPDGRTYSGNFKNGLEDGYGECIMPNKLLNKPDSYLGQWRDGKIHGFGKYKYASGEVYEGCFCDGQRHGYGMLSSGKLARTSSSVFIGQWVHDRKTGYGVYDDITRGEKYMGLWLDDQRHGNAVVVTQYGVYYEGTFKDNKMSGPGLLVSDDDTAFHAEFSDDWTVNGKGVLTLANGDCLDGLFSGEWNTGLKVVGTYIKPVVDETENKDRNSLLRLGQYAVAAGQRWSCVFEECWSRLGCDAAGKGDRTVAWENIAVTITTARRHSPDLNRSQTKILESLEFIPHHGDPVTTSNYDNIRRYLTKACETPLHPLGWLVETLVTVYRMTYVGVGSNRRLLRQAVLEVQAYLTHFYSIIRFLFPGLPDDGETHLSISLILECVLKFAFSFSSSVVVVSCSSLLLPLLLPRLYPPLFTLYCLQEEQDEAQYWERILRLNKQPDQSLLSFLGVQEKFWPVWMSILGEKKQIVSSSKDACFVSAVETLQQISTTFTPSDKLLVIQKTFEELTQEVKPMLDGSFLWCMDDLFPLFLYVVVRARIRNLGAEVSLIEDLMDPNLEHGEMGLMFTTLKACYIQIQQESMT
uniref:Alsin Rho guanine nucleotide exchange factor ALS2 a n=1 Tax=Sphaeramia orbicularis TaxID=375764 RepID=A0A673AXN5_9TELE